MQPKLGLGLLQGHCRLILNALPVFGLAGLGHKGANNSKLLINQEVRRAAPALSEGGLATGEELTVRPKQSSACLALSPGNPL